MGSNRVHIDLAVDAASATSALLRLARAVLGRITLVTHAADSRRHAG